MAHGTVRLQNATGAQQRIASHRVGVGCLFINGMKGMKTGLYATFFMCMHRYSQQSCTIGRRVPGRHLRVTRLTYRVNAGD